MGSYVPVQYVHKCNQPIYLKDTITTIKFVEHPFTIKDPYDVYFACKKLNIPRPNLWVKVCIIETGWKAESWQAQNNYNLFGFSNCRFDSYYDCMKFLKLWIEENPPQYRESDISFLKRRKWNPYPDYYIKIKNLKP